MRFFLSQLTEVWVSFLGALIRFWDNRFQKNECAYCEYFKTEIEKLRRDSSNQCRGESSLNEVYLNRKEELTPEPVRGTQSWSRRQRELERLHLKPNTQISAMPVDKALNELEKEFS